MKYKNANKLILDKLVLLGDKNQFKMLGYNNQVTQYFYWCYFKDEPKNIYCLNERIISEPDRRSELDKEIFKGMKIIIDLKGTLYNTLRRILNENIDKFVNENINNISYLFENDKSDYENISLYEMGKDIRKNQNYGLHNNISLLLNNFEYQDISNGLVKISTRTGKKDFIYDMKKMEFINNEIDIFKAVYGLTSLKKILAYEQYKKGLTPPFYNEVAKINEFLESKKTVTLLLNDGEKIQVPAQISNVLATNYKEFWINTQLNNMDITNLRAIGYGKKELIINTENLINIDKQLDEFIEKSENKELDIEELEDEC